MTLTSLPYQHPIMEMRTSLCGDTYKHSVHHGLIKLRSPPDPARSPTRNQTNS
jgi:hypothetical protein